jgi:hypothetical protein
MSRALTQPGTLPLRVEWEPFPVNQMMPRRDQEAQDPKTRPGAADTTSIGAMNVAAWLMPCGRYERQPPTRDRHSTIVVS